MGSHTGVAVASSLEELGMVAAEPVERKGEEEGERKRKEVVWVESLS